MLLMHMLLFFFPPPFLSQSALQTVDEAGVRREGSRLQDETWQLVNNAQQRRGAF